MAAESSGSGLSEGLALWLAGSRVAGLRERGRLRLGRGCHAYPRQLARRMCELGSRTGTRRVVAARAVLDQLSAPISWPAEFRQAVHASSVGFDEAVRQVPEAAWPGLFEALDADGGRDEGLVARAAARVCGRSARPDAIEALAPRILARLEQDASRPKNQARPSGAFVMAACDLRAPELVPGLHRALLDHPHEWAPKVVPALTEIASVAALRALAAYQLTRDPTTWSAARELRRDAFERHGREIFIEGRHDESASARLLGLEAEIHGASAQARCAALLAALDDESTFVRSRAIRLLASTRGEARRETARAALGRRLAERPSGGEGRELVFALAALGDESVHERLAGYEANDARVEANARAQQEQGWRELRELLANSTPTRGVDGITDLLDQLLEP